MIPIDVTRILLLSLDDEYVLLLRGSQDQRALPIAIGQFEARAIAIRLNNLEVERPLTHDLFKNSLDALGCSLLRVVVCELRDDTFYARLSLRHSSGVLELDARPSDAIALALRYGASVFVEEEVMAQAGVLFTDESQKESERAESRPAVDEPLSPLQQLQEKLAAAVAHEQYEDAAELRDQIRKLLSAN